MAIIMGVDPGSRKTGFGFINSVGGRHEYITSGVIRVPDVSLPERLKVIFDSVSELIERYIPQQFAIEQVFMAKNAGSPISTGPCGIMRNVRAVRVCSEPFNAG